MSECTKLHLVLFRSLLVVGQQLEYLIFLNHRVLHSEC